MSQSYEKQVVRKSIVWRGREKQYDTTCYNGAGEIFQCMISCVVRLKEEKEKYWKTQDNKATMAHNF